MQGLISAFAIDLWQQAGGLSLVKHLISEQKLHVQTGGHWHPDKFGSSSLVADYAPEKQIQFQLPYLIIPISQLTTVAISRENRYSQRFIIERQDGIYVRLFYHPSCTEDFERFAREHHFESVAAENSEYLATPTSSYRSLAVIKLLDGEKADQRFVPCIVKMGVVGTSVGATRDLPQFEVIQSVYMTEHIVKNPQLDEEQFFKEVAGVFHAHTLGIREDSKSGRTQNLTLSNIVREFPAAIINNAGSTRYLSMAALISNQDEHTLPIAYTLAAHYLVKNPGSNLEDFFSDLIDQYLDFSFELWIRGIMIEPHAQNLGVVVVGGCVSKFFIRDGGGYTLFNQDNPNAPLPQHDYCSLQHLTAEQKDIFFTRFSSFSRNTNRKFLNQHSWFFGYQVIQKMLNIFAESKTYDKFNLELQAQTIRYLVQSKDMTPVQIPVMADKVPTTGARAKVDKNSIPCSYTRDTVCLINETTNSHTSIEISLREAIARKKDLLERRYASLSGGIDILSMFAFLKLDEDSVERLRRYIPRAIIEKLKAKYGLNELPEEMNALLSQFPAVEWSEHYKIKPILVDFHGFFAQIRTVKEEQMRNSPIHTPKDLSHLYAENRDVPRFC